VVSEALRRAMNEEKALLKAATNPTASPEPPRTLIHKTKKKPS
jgi:hypothetical protein